MEQDSLKQAFAYSAEKGMSAICYVRDLQMFWLKNLNSIGQQLRWKRLITNSLGVPTIIIEICT